MNKRNIIFFIIATSVFVVMFRLTVVRGNNENIVISSSQSNGSSNVSDYYVNLTGEVINPGVYVIDSTYSLMDLVAEAGGFTSDASDVCINLSIDLLTVQTIIIYSHSECDNLSNSNSSGGVSNGLVNINYASLEELKSVNGIGDTIANNIIEYRNTNGFFSSLEELKNVSRIGDVTYENIREYLTV